MPRWTKSTWIILLLLIAAGGTQGTIRHDNPVLSFAFLFLGCILMTAASVYHLVVNKREGWKMGISVGIFASSFSLLGWLTGAMIHAMTGYAMWFEVLLPVITALFSVLYLLPERKSSTFGS